MGLDFFYSKKYLNLLIDVLDIEIKSLKAGGKDVMYYGSKSGDLGTVMNALPFFGSFGGPIHQNLSELGEINDQLESIIAGEDPFSFLVVENPFYPIEPDVLKKFSRVDHRIFQYSELPSNSNDLMSLVEASARRNIKKAVNYNIKVACSDPSHEFNMKWHTLSMRRKNVQTKPESFYQGVKHHFEYGKEYAIYHAYLENKKIASLLIFYCKDVVEYFIPAYDPEFLSLEPMALITHQAMVDAVERGYKTWNWGGINPQAQSVYRFKKKWFAKELCYRYFMYLKNDCLSKLRPKDMEGYDYFYVFPYSKMAEAYSEKI